ncbi:MAG TPA: DUF1015 domain-containing protein [Polyangiaceae bacterium]|jgi:uncharacterized protein (DUF1015 family)|nr:DUF1015 domain-containing protein [Polyangiaceae bacterium]
MADIAPLRPLRYKAPDLAPLVAPPYDVISPAERAELMARSPHNVVRLILPDGEGDAKYGHAATLLGGWRNEGVLTRDETPSFYRYQQTFTPPGGGAQRTRRGFLALVRLVPFSDRVVLPHERTLSGPKEDRLKLFRATRANLSPGFMLYRDPDRVLDAPLESGTKLTAFVTADGIEHRLSKVAGAEAIRTITEHIAKSSLLIADGHHRYETALHYAREVDAARAEKPYGPRAEHRYFMSFLCNGDDPDLLVFATHRLVHSLSSFDWDDFLRHAGTLFEVSPLSGDLGQVEGRLAESGRKGTSFVALAAPKEGTGRMALLTLKPNADLAKHPTLGQRPKAVRSTDAAILHSGILEHLLGISIAAQEKKTNLLYLQDPRQGLAAVERGEGQVLFLMNPTPVTQVREVAEAGEVMPQKSTYFYPKVLTGLTIHTLDPQRTV